MFIIVTRKLYILNLLYNSHEDFRQCWSCSLLLRSSISYTHPNFHLIRRNNKFFFLFRSLNLKYIVRICLLRAWKKTFTVFVVWYRIYLPHLWTIGDHVCNKGFNSFSDVDLLHNNLYISVFWQQVTDVTRFQWTHYNMWGPVISWPNSTPVVFAVFVLSSLFVFHV